MIKFKIVIFSILFFAFPLVAKPISDGERLRIALDYFQSGKYHETLLIFQKLDSNYQLNPRFIAYTGVCYYYEWDYQHATECLDRAIPQLKSFAPSELSFYYFADAESYFNLNKYDMAIPLYKEMLTLCQESEKADAYYKLGYIYSSRNEWIDALDNLHMALTYFLHFRAKEQARITQIRNMIIGCCEMIDKRSGK